MGSSLERLGGADESSSDTSAELPCRKSALRVSQEDSDQR
jgi:hypothetical protein